MRERASRDNKGLLDIFMNPTRRNILELCKEKPHTIIGLEKFLKLGHGTILYHVNFLKKMGLVITDKKNNEVGRPTYVKHNPDGYKKLVEGKAFKVFEKNKELILKILDYIQNQQKQKNAVMEWGLYVKFKEYDQETIYKALNFLKINNYLGFVVTEEGELFLKDNSK